MCRATNRLPDNMSHIQNFALGQPVIGSIATKELGPRKDGPQVAPVKVVQNLLTIFPYVQVVCFKVS